MPQSLANILVHIIYSTKNRVPLLKDEKIRNELYAYKATLLTNNVDSPAIKIGGMSDHVHILCALSRKFAIMNVVNELKSESTKWIKRKTGLNDFSWQIGYGAFSVSASNRDQVKHYIENQHSHHRQMSFKEEFRVLCEKHGVELDERYVWD